MAADEILFDVEAGPRLQPGDKVIVQAMWGDERAEVCEVFYEDGFPMVKLLGQHGDTISISVARVILAR